MGPTLSAVLDDARRRGFVGRAPELRSFAARAGRHRPGPGAVRARARRHRQVHAARRAAPARGRRRSRPALLLHGRDLGGSIEDVAPRGRRRCRTARGRCCWSTGTSCSPGWTGGSASTCCRRCRPTRWSCWPAGSRRTPAWSADPGWRQLLRRLDLAVLPPAESVELLCRLGVPEDQRGRLAALGRGHPLTLTLLAEACAGGAVPTRLDQLPQLVAELCRVLVREVPDADHRTGLATCAHAYRTTEDLLAATVGPRAPEVWAWLAARPFVGRSGDGLHLHDLVRDVFDAEFAQRNPDAYVALHRTMRQHAVGRLLDPASLSRHRDATRADAAAPAQPARAAGPPAARLRRAGRGPGCAGRPGRSARDRRRRGGAGGRASCTAGGSTRSPPVCTWPRSETGVEAFGLHVYVSPEDNPVPERPGGATVLDAIERAVAAAAGRAGRHLPRHGQPRHLPARRAGRARRLGVLPRRVAVPAGRLDRRHRAARGLLAAVLRIPRLRRAGPGAVRRRRRDRVRVGPAAAAAGGVPGADRAARADRGDRPAAGRAAAAGPARPGRLRGGGPGRAARRQPPGPAGRQPAGRHRARSRTCAASLLAGIARLAEEPKGEPLRRVLDRTYLCGTPSQEAAAEVLGLPFSTYRRYLGRATARLVDLLVGRSKWAPTEQVLAWWVSSGSGDGPRPWQRSSSSGPA